ncbi:MAG TPA: hypothetical protein VGM63_09940, partial [Mucilaginibacter sp.]
MTTFDFFGIDKQYNSAAEIRQLIEKNMDGFGFKTKIFRARHYSDQAHDILEAAFVGQQLSKFAKRISLSQDIKYMFDTIVDFVFEPNDCEALSQLIYNYGQMTSGKNKELGEKFVEELSRYRDDLETIDHAFPELVEDYYTSFIYGEYYEYDPVDCSEFFDGEFFKFPERSFGFFKSAFSKKIGQDFYSSMNSMIISNSSDLDLILKEYSGLENLHLVKAEYFAVGNVAYLISDGLIVHFPFDSFIQAKECAWSTIEPKDEIYADKGQWANGLMSYNRSFAELDELENARGYPEDLSEKIISGELGTDAIMRKPPVMSFYLSAYGNFLMAKDSGYSYFFFSTDELTPNELIMLGNKLSTLFRTTAGLAGILVEIKCPWELLNDALFEDLCFDIIYYNPKFDNSTIRKMGKTKSRDGGRDIEVHTHARPGHPSVKYIFQCKYQTTGTSLSAAKVQNISDTVTQYNAKGYGVMTNVVIDATL